MWLNSPMAVKHIPKEQAYLSHLLFTANESVQFSLRFIFPLVSHSHSKAVVSYAVFVFSQFSDICGKEGKPIGHAPLFPLSRHLLLRATSRQGVQSGRVTHCSYTLCGWLTEHHSPSVIHLLSTLSFPMVKPSHPKSIQ